MRPSRRVLTERNRTLGARAERLDAALAETAAKAEASASQLRRISHELSDLKDEIALHIVAAKHPSSALSTAHAMAISLQESLDARGIDLRIELARLEGADL